jgi:hypothetical protein
MDTPVRPIKIEKEGVYSRWGERLHPLLTARDVYEILRQIGGPETSPVPILLGWFDVPAPGEGAIDSLLITVEDPFPSPH